MFATYIDGQVVFDERVFWPSGTRVAITPVEKAAGASTFANVEARKSDEDFERLIDEACAIVDASVGPGRAPLSDYAVSRQGIYEDHS
jgi:hypothetical protein